MTDREFASQQLGALNWEEAAEALHNLPVLVPVGGSLIEHGPHLPYDTDRLIAEALVAAVAERVPVLVTPSIDYVYAPLSADRGGTVSISPRIFIRFAMDILSSLARHGARHIVLVVRGVGTLAPLNIISRELYERYGVTVAIANPLGLAYDTLQALVDSPSGDHANEIETSLMLHIAKDNVRLDQAVSERLDPPRSSQSTLHEPVFILPERISGSATIDGAPGAATVAKGQQIFEAMVAEIVGHLNDQSSIELGRIDADRSQRMFAPARWEPGERELPGILAERLYAPDWDRALAECEVAVLPMGAASKEHGYHMPNQTDFLTAEALRAAVVERLPVLALPTFGYGYYPAFIDWPGSMTLNPETYQAVIADVIQCLAQAGIRKLLLLDTGVSTRPVLEIVAREAHRQHGTLVALATTELGRDAAHDLFDGAGTHANEDETALMLAIAPNQVRMDRAVPDLRPSTRFDRRDPLAPPAFIQGGKMQSISGVFGDPTKATAKNGQLYLQAKIDDLVEFLEMFARIEIRA